MLAQICGNQYKKSCIKLSLVRFSQKKNFQLLPVCHEIQKRLAILLYLFWDKAPFGVFWTEVPVLSIKLSMHLTIKETKLKLKDLQTSLAWRA